MRPVSFFRGQKKSFHSQKWKSIIRQYLHHPAEAPKKLPRNTDSLIVTNIILIFSPVTTPLTFKQFLDKSIDQIEAYGSSISVMTKHLANKLTSGTVCVFCHWPPR
jgi:hypothetical protein